MAQETLAASLTEIVRSEKIAEQILAYGIDATVILPLVRQIDLAGQGTYTASFPQWEKDAVSDLTTEGTTTFSNVELQTTEVATISCAVVGILREFSKLAERSNMLGDAEIIRFTMEDSGKLCFDEVENDLAALFSGLTTSVGSTGVDMSVANHVQAIAKMRTQKCRGNYVAVYDDQAHSDLLVSIAGSTGAVFGNANVSQSMLNANSDGYMGNLFGVDCWVTNLTDTANTGADVVSAMFCNGSSTPAYAAFGLAVLWNPEADMLFLPDQNSRQVAVSMAYGCGRISDFGCKIVTDA